MDLEPSHPPQSALQKSMDRLNPCWFGHQVRVSQESKQMLAGTQSARHILQRTMLSQRAQQRHHCVSLLSAFSWRMLWFSPESLSHRHSSSVEQPGKGHSRRAHLSEPFQHCSVRDQFEGFTSVSDGGFWIQFSQSLESVGHTLATSLGRLRALAWAGCSLHNWTQLFLTPPSGLVKAVSLPNRTTSIVQQWAQVLHGRARGTGGGFPPR